MSGKGECEVEASWRSHLRRRLGKKLAMSLDIDLIKAVTQKWREVESNDTKRRERWTNRNCGSAQKPLGNGQ